MTLKVIAVLLIVAAACWGATITVTDPLFGTAWDNVNGDPLKFAEQSATFSYDGTDSLSVALNYGVPLPGSPDIVPVYLDEGFPIYEGDFLIYQGSNIFGIVLSPHDGYTPGDVYQASGVQLSTFGRAGFPVALASGGTLVQAGVITALVNSGCNGANCALYTIDVTFPGVPHFLNEDLGFSVGLAPSCDNSYLGGSVPGKFGDAPEPGTLLMFGSALIGLSVMVKRRSSK